LTFVNNRIQNIENAIDNATESANSETKSSAGDKHETSRAMAHLEQEKSSLQLKEAMKLKNTLLAINPEIVSSKVALGSLVITDNGNFYISIPAGKMEWAGSSYFAISQVSPIAQKMIGNSVGNDFEFNKVKYLIQEIL
jgi:hypothetical protein